MNILDYLATEFATFEEKPFNPVDSAVLSQFCMVHVVLHHSASLFRMARRFKLVGKRWLFLFWESCVRLCG